ncbi:hypothetical protein TNCV_1890191 [Trichonephila clavipes]|nr:hypothetical protein TNCV_1890191 [Trichonephila clavipes]
MLVRLPRAPVLSGSLRRKTQLFSGTLYMAASSKTPPHQSKGPQKFSTPLQVPVFPGSSLLCRHTSCGKPSDTTSFHSVLVCHRTSSQEVGEVKVKVKIARERRVRETRTHKRVSPCQKITRVPRDCDTRTHLKKKQWDESLACLEAENSTLWNAAREFRKKAPPIPALPKLLIATPTKARSLQTRCKINLN